MEDRLVRVRHRLAEVLRARGYDSGAALLDSGAPGLGSILVPELTRAVTDAQADLLGLLETLTRLYPEGGSTAEYQTLYAQRVAAERTLDVARSLQRAVTCYYRALDASVQGGEAVDPAVLAEDLETVETVLHELGDGA